MERVYIGSCHCGAVRFEATIDLAQPTFRCNCSICSRTRFWPAIVRPESVQVLSGQDELTKYLFNTRRNEHWFCRTCGVRPFGIGHLPDGTRIYGINIGCLEGVSPEVLAAAPIVYVDGSHDAQTPPEITSYL
jgi:hypothetical protein